MRQRREALLELLNSVLVSKGWRDLIGSVFHEGRAIVDGLSEGAQTLALYRRPAWQLSLSHSDVMRVIASFQENHIDRALQMYLT